MSTLCRKCILSDDVPGTKIGSDRLCGLCAGREEDEWLTRFEVTDEKKAALQQELEDELQRAKNNDGYHCALAVSGGKDSAYLLHHLAVERGLKVLGVNVRTPFESDIAHQNLKQLQEKIPFDLVVVDPGDDFYRTFYTTLFLNPVTEGYVKSICYVCNPFFTGCLLKEATARNIPLAFIGVSPFQPENMFFEWERERVGKRSWLPELFDSEEFSEEFRSQFWDPNAFPKGTNFPRLIAPLHVWDYNTHEIMKALQAADILPKKKLSPMVTNCALNWPMIYLDTQLLGHNPYVKEFASLVRSGQSPRSYWRFLMVIVDALVKLNLFKRSELKRIEAFLEVEFDKCPSSREQIAREYVEYP